MLQVTNILTQNLIKQAAIAFDWEATDLKFTSYEIKSGQMVTNLLTAIRSCGFTFDVWPNKSSAFDFTFRKSQTA